MKTHVLFGIVAFLVRPIWVLLAEAGYILRLLARVEAHPRTTLQAAVDSFRRYPLPEERRKETAGGSRRFGPRLYERPSRPGLDARRSGFKGRTTPLGPTAASARSSATATFKTALKCRGR